MATNELQRLHAVVWGAVQGVGFRPFLALNARELGLSGWVRNTGAGVEVEVEGASPAVATLLERIRTNPPEHTIVNGIETSWLDPVGLVGFEILESAGGSRRALILPDIATCARCLAEILDPSDRRYRYPFTNCTHCGPRFSIIEAVPYDRANTTMRRFKMCPDCQREYGDAADRRFHAQPNACPACGPQLALWDHRGRVLETRDSALVAAADAIRAGGILAVKGLGGFHLMADAQSDEAVLRLRRLKRREEKPFALMAPKISVIEAFCEISEADRRLLRSSSAPITLLSRRAVNGGPSEAVAPDNPNLGVMLPYTPLHHLLMAELGFSVVATSGNVADEPICTDETEALRRLGPMCDLLLVHDRPIARHMDDSIVRMCAGKPMVLRRSRGYAPLPVTLPEAPPAALAVGAHLKNAVALSVGRDVFLGQHIGDLETEEASRAFERSLADLPDLYDARPRVVACDLHPGYVSTMHARNLGLRVVPVQHHLAHVFACAAENAIAPPYLGIAWDGTGHGDDGTIWGGEFFVVRNDCHERFASFETFPLPGGEAAIREPRRSALGALFASFGDDAFGMGDLPPLREFSKAELRVLSTMLRGGVNAPVTSSAGRLFDAVAAIAGLKQMARFEGQAAMRVEFEAATSREARPYVIDLRSNGGGGPGARFLLDWKSMLSAIVADVRAGESVSAIAAGFHKALVGGIAAVAVAAGLPRVLLTGGCFQNRLLLESAVTVLREQGFTPSWHQRVPPNDGGIALGQIAALLRQGGL